MTMTRDTDHMRSEITVEQADNQVLIGVDRDSIKLSMQLDADRIPEDPETIEHELRELAQVALFYGGRVA